MLEVELIPSIIIFILLLIWGIYWGRKFNYNDVFFIGVTCVLGIIIGFIVISIFFSNFLNLEYGIIMFLGELIGIPIGIWSFKREKKL